MQQQQSDVSALHRLWFKEQIWCPSGCFTDCLCQNWVGSLQKSAWHRCKYAFCSSWHFQSSSLTRRGVSKKSCFFMNLILFLILCTKVYPLLCIGFHSIHFTSARPERAVHSMTNPPLSHTSCLRVQMERREFWSPHANKRKFPGTIAAVEFLMPSRPL